MKRLKWCQRLSSSSSGVKSHDVGVNVSRVGSSSESVRLSSSSFWGKLTWSSGVPGGRRRRIERRLVAEEGTYSKKTWLQKRRRHRGNTRSVTHTHTEYYYFYFAQFEAAILKQILENQREAQVQTLLATTLCRRAPVLGPAAVQILHNLFLVSPNYYYYYYYSMAINLHFVS